MLLNLHIDAIHKQNREERPVNRFGVDDGVSFGCRLLVFVANGDGPSDCFQGEQLGDWDVNMHEIGICLDFPALGLIGEGDAALCSKGEEHSEDDVHLGEERILHIAVNLLADVIENRGIAAGGVVLLTGGDAILALEAVHHLNEVLDSHIRGDAYLAIWCDFGFFGFSFSSPVLVHDNRLQHSEQFWY